MTLKQGIKQLLSKSQIRDEFFVVISFMKLRANTMTSIGKMKYILLNHQKTDSLIFHDKKIIKSITFPNDVIPSNLLIKKITKIVMLG